MTHDELSERLTALVAEAREAIPDDEIAAELEALAASLRE